MSGPMRIGAVLASMGWDKTPGFTGQGVEAKRAYADYLRGNQTPSERLMARVLFHLGINAEPQVPLLGWIVDFYDAEHRTVIEVDGSIHDYQLKADRFRDEKMTEVGYRAMRFRNDEVPHLMQAIALGRA